MFKIIGWGHLLTMLWCVSNVFFLIFVESTTEEHFSSEKRAKANRLWGHLMCHYKFTAGWVFVKMVRKSQKSLCVLKNWQVMHHTLVIHVGEKNNPKQLCNLCRKRVLYCICALYSLYCLFYFKAVTAALIILIFCLAWSLHTAGALHYRKPTFTHSEWTYSLDALLYLLTVCELRHQASKLGVPVAALGVKMVLETLTEITGTEKVKEDENMRTGLLISSQRVSVWFYLIFIRTFI